MDHAFRPTQGRVAPDVEQKDVVIKRFQNSKRQVFGHDQQSPLTPDQRKKFAGLSCYPEKPGLAFAVEFTEEAKEVIEMVTSIGGSASHLRWGEF
jgi:uncharacterized protein (DUF1684 family)